MKASDRASSHEPYANSSSLGKADLILRASYFYRYAIRVVMPFAVGKWIRIRGPSVCRYFSPIDWMLTGNPRKWSIEPIVIKVFDYVFDPSRVAIRRSCIQGKSYICRPYIVWWFHLCPLFQNSSPNIMFTLRVIIFTCDTPLAGIQEFLGRPKPCPYSSARWLRPQKTTPTTHNSGGTLVKSGLLCQGNFKGCSNKVNLTGGLIAT
jgi:hypothetical protein